MRYLQAQCLLCALVLLVSSGFSQVPGTQGNASIETNTSVPRLVNFSGKAIDAQGKTISGIAGVTFAIYKEETGGVPLWLETQNIQADTKGNYTAQLGATAAEGLPLDLFTSGDARWLGVSVNSGEEQPRVLLLSVPYALKAADAQTLGGLPSSAFARVSGPVAGSPSAAPTPNSPTQGTVTSVGLSAPNSDFFVTGSPVTKSGTLGLNWNIQPTAFNVAGALVKRGNTGDFSAARSVWDR